MCFVGKKRIFIAPSLPFQGDQAVDDHVSRAQTRPSQRGGGGLVEPIFSLAIFSKIVSCVTAGIMRIYQYSIRIHFGVCLDLYF